MLKRFLPDEMRLPVALSAAVHGVLVLLIFALGMVPNVGNLAGGGGGGNGGGEGGDGGGGGEQVISVAMISPDPVPAPRSTPAKKIVPKDEPRSESIPDVTPEKSKPEPILPRKIEEKAQEKKIPEKKIEAPEKEKIQEKLIPDIKENTIPKKEEIKKEIAKKEIAKKEEPKKPEAKKPEPKKTEAAPKPTAQHVMIHPSDKAAMASKQTSSSLRMPPAGALSPAAARALRGNGPGTGSSMRPGTGSKVPGSSPGAGSGTGTGTGNGRGSGSGTGDGDGTTVGNASLKGTGLPRYYAQQALTKVGRYFRIPPTQERDVDAILTIRINRDGSLENPRIKKSSGDPSLDRYAMLAITATQTFAPLPDDFSSSAVDVDITFNFRQ